MSPTIGGSDATVPTRDYGFNVQFKDNIAQSQLALDEYKKGLQAMADNLTVKFVTSIKYWSVWKRSD